MRTRIHRDGLAGIIWTARDRCAGCQRDVHDLGEYFMVHDHVWRAVMPTSAGYLCVGCLEVLLGRDLNPDDFTDCPLNVGNQIVGSLRLRRRLFGTDDPPAPDELIDTVRDRIAHAHHHTAHTSEDP